MNVALCFFGKQVNDLYKNDENVIIFDDQGWSIMINGSRNNVAIDHFQPVGYSNEFNTVLSELRNNMPTISRWNSRGDTYEQLLRRSARQVLCIATGLKSYSISKCIVSTGVNHHLDSTILELAGRLASIPRVYLYVNNISGRLLPLIQSEDISSRRGLGNEISNYDASNDVLEFSSRARQNHAPLIGGLILKTDVTNYYRAVLLSIYFDLRSLLGLVKAILFGNKIAKHDYTYTTGSYPFQNINQVIAQHQGLLYYEKNISKVPVSGKKGVKLIIMAHFQPEATSFPEGGSLWNHIDIVYKLRSLGYKESLYYKEHFASSLYFTSIGATQVGAYRDIHYYKHLESLNCLFVRDIEGEKYGGSKCQEYVPVTITGSVAVERALNGLCTIVTGYPWYMGLPGVIHINDITDLNNLSPDLLEFNQDIATDAHQFLVSLLSKKTLTNATGIGLTGILDTSLMDDFKNEFDRLLFSF